MHFCILAEYSAAKYLEGTNRIVFEVSKTLVEKGHKVTVLSPAWNKKSNPLDIDPWKKEGIIVKPFEGFFLHNPFFRIFFYILAGLKSSPTNFDVFFGVYTAPPAIAAIVLGSLFRKKKFVGLWEPNTIEKLKNNPFFRFFIKKADRIQTLSDYVKNLISKSFSYPSKKIYSIKGFVDTEKFYPEAMDRNLVKKFDLKNKFVILSVGRVSKLKGSDTLIKAVAKINDHSIKLFFVGRPTPDFDSKKLVKELGIEKNVVFIGFKKHDFLPPYYNLCNLFSLPSLSEGFGLVVAEALACAKPVIVSDHGPLPEVVSNAGFVVPVNDVDKLAQAILKIKNNSNILNLQKKALIRSKAFTLENAMNRYLNFLTK